MSGASPSTPWWVWAVVGLFALLLGSGVYLGLRPLELPPGAERANVSNGELGRLAEAAEKLEVAVAEKHAATLAALVALDQLAPVREGDVPLDAPRAYLLSAPEHTHRLLTTVYPELVPNALLPPKEGVPYGRPELRVRLVGSAEGREVWEAAYPATAARPATHYHFGKEGGTWRFLARFASPSLAGVEVAPAASATPP